MTEPAGPVRRLAARDANPNLIQEADAARKFEVYKDRAGKSRVRVKLNSEVILSTVGCASKAGAKNAIESIKKNGPDAPTDDTTG